MARSTTPTKSEDITLDDLNAQMQTLKSDIAALTSAVGAYGKAKGAEAMDGAKANARAAKELTADQIEALSAHAQKLGQDLHNQADTFVKQQPATALGIAAGAGFLIGLLTARK